MANRLPPAVPGRTLRFWLARYRLAKEQCGNGYVGLLPKTGRRGNRTLRLPEESRNLLTEFVVNDYESLKHKLKSSFVGGAETDLRREGRHRAELCHILSCRPRAAGVRADTKSAKAAAQPAIDRTLPSISSCSPLRRVMETALWD